LNVITRVGHLTRLSIRCVGAIEESRSSPFFTLFILAITQVLGIKLFKTIVMERKKIEGENGEDPNSL
jgi:hypothetical protein